VQSVINAAATDKSYLSVDAFGGGTGTYGTLLTSTVSVTLNSKLEISFMATFGIAGATRGFFRIKVDGAVVVTAGQNSWGDSTSFDEGVSLQWLTGALVAGNHTVAIEWRPEGNAVTIHCPAQTGAAIGYFASMIIKELAA